MHRLIWFYSPGFQLFCKLISSTRQPEKDHRQLFKSNTNEHGFENKER